MMKRDRSAGRKILTSILAGFSLLSACSSPPRQGEKRPSQIFTDDYHDRRLLNICPHKRIIARKDLEDLARTYYILDVNGNPQISTILEKNKECRSSTAEQLELGDEQCALRRDSPPCRAGVVLIPIR